MRLGYRLDVPVLKTIHTMSGPQCVLHCLKDACCRSVNYNTRCLSSQNKTNCELLHGVASEEPGLLRLQENFNHLVLLQPNRVSCYTKYSYANVQCMVNIFVSRDGAGFVAWLQWRSQLDKLGGHIHIFVICTINFLWNLLFYGLWTRIYEYVPLTYRVGLRHCVIGCLVS